jgi:hypothetical protein
MAWAGAGARRGAGVSSGSAGSCIDSIEATTSSRAGRDSQTTPKPASRAACAMRGCVATARAACQGWPGQQLQQMAMASELLSSHTLPSVAACRASAICACASRPAGSVARPPHKLHHGARSLRAGWASQSRPAGGLGVGATHDQHASPGRTWAPPAAHSDSESNCGASGAGVSMRAAGTPAVQQRIAGARAGDHALKLIAHEAFCEGCRAIFTKEMARRHCR